MIGRYRALPTPRPWCQYRSKSTNAPRKETAAKASSRWGTLSGSSRRRDSERVASFAIVLGPREHAAGEQCVEQVLLLLAVGAEGLGQPPFALRRQAKL